MENKQELSDRLELIDRSRRGMGARLHSPLPGYIALGLLWAAPIGAFAFGRGWAALAALVAVAITALWSLVFTRRRGVRLSPFAPTSAAARLGGWMLAGWALCLVAGFIGGTAAPVMPWIAATIAAALVAVLGARIDRAIVREATGAAGRS